MSRHDGREGCPDVVAEAAAVRAADCLGAITRRLFDARRGLFGARRVSGGRRYEQLWPFANAWAAAGVLAGLPATGPAATGMLAGLLGGVAAYGRTGASGTGEAPPGGFESQVVPPLGAGGDVYYDDNAWVGLAALAQHERTGEPAALRLAAGLLETTTAGWSTERRWAHPGGIRWKPSPATSSRNTCANAPVAELAVRLYRHTGDPAQLEWGHRLYEWVRSALLRPDDLYADRVAPDGRVEATPSSYNQGTMIGAGVLLHEATGEPAFLEHAAATAGAALGRFDGPALLGQGPAFNAIYFRNLWLLGRHRPDRRVVRTAAAYADEMWRHHRSRRTGLFTGAGSTLNRSAPMAAVFALLAGAPPGP
ncbi:MAG: glycoside hydrolase family 76 protein [Acidimicrobiales bacterium]